MTQKPPRVQYLLSELSTEIQAIQHQLECALERCGHEAEHEKLVVPSREDPAPTGQELQFPSSSSKDTREQPAESSRECSKMTCQTHSASDEEQTPCPSAEPPLVTFLSPLPEGVFTPDAKVQPSPPASQAHRMPSLPGANQPTDAEVLAQKVQASVQQGEEDHIQRVSVQSLQSMQSLQSGVSATSHLSQPSLASGVNWKGCLSGKVGPYASQNSGVSGTAEGPMKKPRHTANFLSVENRGCSTWSKKSGGSDDSRIGRSTIRSTLGDAFTSMLSKAHTTTFSNSIKEWRMKRSGTKPIKPTSARQAMVIIVDVIPPIVIVLNAVTIGMSADIAPESAVWSILEGIWICVYFLEFITKLYLLGLAEYFFGPERLWNVFDSTCLSVSLIDVAVTYMFTFMTASGGSVGLLKMLRLVRLLRLVRALHFPIFDELKQMIIGVVAGMRVLIWAIVLLFVIIFFVGVMVNNLWSEEEKELSNLPMSMLTVFRCYTDGCSAFDGTPLAARLFQDYGALFFFGYILSFMFVNLGIFNLIMALFIENIVARTLQKKLKDIGDQSEETRDFIEDTLLMLITEEENFESALSHDPKTFSTPSKSWAASTSNQSFDAKAMFGDLQDNDFRISRNTFEMWLDHPVMNAMFSRANIDVANHADLFDTLDAGLSGELALSELVIGLLTMRGPITKSDIVAVRLKTCHLVDVVEEMKSSLELVMEKVLGGRGSSPRTTLRHTVQQAT